MIGHSVANCHWFHPEKSVTKDNNNVSKPPDKGKQIVTHQKVQTKKWQPTGNPFGIGSSMAFSKLGVPTDIAITTTTSEQLIDSHVSPTSNATVDTQGVLGDIVPKTIPTDVDSSVHHDKVAFTYNLAFENVTDEII